jgi:hypothetical protein
LRGQESQPQGSRWKRPAWDAPICQAWTSWSGLSAEWSRFPGRPLAGCNLGTWNSRGRVSGRDFDHAQSVNFRPNPTLRSGHSCCGPRYCGFGPGPPRPRHLFLMDNAQSKPNRSGQGFQAEMLCILSSRRLTPRAAATFRKRLSVYELGYATRPCFRKLTVKNS